MQDTELICAVAPSLPKIATHPTEETLGHLRLLQVLQTSLNVEELLNNFFKHIQPLISIAGISFHSAHTVLDFGRKTIHQCDYNLIIENDTLGKIIFNQRSRWSEADLIIIENLLSYLVYPLRNAIAHQQMIKLARVDSLTLIGNRAAFDEQISRAIQSAHRHQQPLSFLMLDIDYFKSINDRFGHLIGDKVLQQVAFIIQQACRSTDNVYRYGGEEFVVLLGNTALDGAKVFAERLNQLIATLVMGNQDKALELTVSMGVTELNSADTIDSLIGRADTALYQAKHGGRNRIEYIE